MSLLRVYCIVQTTNLYYGLSSTAEMLQLDNRELRSILAHWNSTLENVVSVKWNKTNHIAFMVRILIFLIIRLSLLLCVDYARRSRLLRHLIAKATTVLRPKCMP